MREVASLLIAATVLIPAVGAAVLFLSGMDCRGSGKDE